MVRSKASKSPAKRTASRARPENGKSAAAQPVAELRLQVMRAIAAHLARADGTQGEQADRLEISRPRLNALLKERVELFGLDSLVQIAMRSGLSVRLALARNHVRRGGR